LQNKKEELSDGNNCKHPCISFMSSDKLCPQNKPNKTDKPLNLILLLQMKVQLNIAKKFTIAAKFPQFKPSEIFWNLAQKP
jgi:hypothetical protein